MPVYDYFCEGCKKPHEIIHPMNDNMIYLCRSCNQPMQKIPTAPKGIRMTHDSFNSADGKRLEKKYDYKTYSQAK